MDDSIVITFFFQLIKLVQYPEQSIMQLKSMILLPFLKYIGIFFLQIQIQLQNKNFIQFMKYQQLKFQRSSPAIQKMRSICSQIKIKCIILSLALFFLFILPITIFAFSQLNASIVQSIQASQLPSPQMKNQNPLVVQTPQLPPVMHQIQLQMKYPSVVQPSQTPQPSILPQLPQKKTTLNEEFAKLKLEQAQKDIQQVSKDQIQTYKVSIREQIDRRVNKISEPVEYQRVKKQWVEKQIAFCLITLPMKQKLKKSIIGSLNDLKYTNYHIQSIKKLFAIDKKCQLTDVIVFINSPVPSDFLTTLNADYQKNKIWATVQKISSKSNQQYYSLSSFHGSLLKSLRIFEQQWLLSIKDDMKMTEALLFFLEVCSQNIMVISKDMNFVKQDFIQEHLVDLEKEVFLVKRDQYTALRDLSSLPVLEGYESNIIQVHYQFIDLPYTNINHSLIQNQINHYIEKYPTYKQDTKCSVKYNKQQARICLLVYFYNSEVSLETVTFFYSIRNQLYKNFHVIFFDDSSQNTKYKNLLDLFLQLDVTFTYVFIANPTHIGQLGSIRYIFENKLCKQNEIFVYMRAQDFLYGNFALSHIKRSLSKKDTVLAKIKQINKNNQASYHYAMRIDSKQILTVIEECQKLSAKDFNSNENASLAIFQQALPIYFSPVLVDEICFIVAPKNTIHVKFTKKNPDLMKQNLKEDDLFGEPFQQQNTIIYKSALLGTKDNQQRKLLQYKSFKSEEQIWQFSSSNPNTKQFSPLNLKNKVKLAFLLSLTNSSIARQVQYYYFDKIYNIGNSKEQRKICIVGGHYNFLRRNTYYLFLESIALQNYTNYRVVIIDDKSTDGSIRMIRKLVKEKYPVLESKLILLEKKKKMGSLLNKYEGIKYCDPQSIVLDVDSDDFLAGVQVFNLVNAAYQKQPELWLIYFNFINIKNHIYKPGTSKTLPQQYFYNGRYRFAEKFWRTGHLKTMRAKLILQSFPDNGEGSRAADRHIMYSNIELAGAKHVKHISENVYMNYNPPLKQCDQIQQVYEEYLFRNKVPYKNLNSLEDQRQKLDIQIPNAIKLKFNTLKQMTLNCTQQRQIKRKSQLICISQI